MASLASFSGTRLPPEGWLCTMLLGVDCMVTLRPSWALPRVAWRCRPGVDPLTATPPPEGWLSPLLAASPLHRHPKGGSYSIPHLCDGNLCTGPWVSPKPSRCTHATSTWRPPGPWPLLAEPCYCVLPSLKKGAPKAPSRPGRWAVRRFVCGRATRMASLASRSGTCLPPEGWICTVAAYCEDCESYGDVTALDGVA